MNVFHNLFIFFYIFLKVNMFEEQHNFVNDPQRISWALMEHAQGRQFMLMDGCDLLSVEMNPAMSLECLKTPVQPPSKLPVPFARWTLNLFDAELGADLEKNLSVYSQNCIVPGVHSATIYVNDDHEQERAKVLVTFERRAKKKPRLLFYTSNENHVIQVLEYLFARICDVRNVHLQTISTPRPQ